MKQTLQRRFSLLENGILDKPCAKTLIINVRIILKRLLVDTHISQGMLDNIFPVEDSFLALQHGSIKEARFMPDLKHLGEPVAEPIIYDWIEKIFRHHMVES